MFSVTVRQHPVTLPLLSAFFGSFSFRLLDQNYSRSSVCAICITALLTSIDCSSAVATLVYSIVLDLSTENKSCDRVDLVLSEKKRSLCSPPKLNMGDHCAVETKEFWILCFCWGWWYSWKNREPGGGSQLLFSPPLLIEQSSPVKLRSEGVPVYSRCFIWQGQNSCHCQKKFCALWLF